ncbi:MULTISPECIES: SDR family oxidoreductase [unclassified Pseudomonas]|uniref:SDR family oxidoreductase n=1 Tax=unclassified Pseudomonas TaxID=196821 RepID=UPI000BCEDE39|nr:MULTISPECIES: SDR family oxidoreductase [unclassified Pseudomonas]PVZ15311.1 nucleoside-diphosphate-sugar epimerase [Pseudomonas sp. URIL14HWK12:I12]PVZ24685.1 nucleoside-diphosphate-sugar epimerase [Pseudomonas sp. URIL14HWK12:I10]PVZ34530.1 nucleoside-diphosphate-sugar epimerase [Pseudomonas sp. URIL14HWK12:I11]SNZ08566.1 Nucleoside-diphosphate-sugar epimerase [Pseudomonas sp. URIL14HWK12:I9]
MGSPTVLLVGCGDVGGRLAQALLAAGWLVHGLRRDTTRLPAGVVPVPADLASPAMPAAWPEGPLDYVVYCVAASQHDEAGYRQAYVEGLRHTLSWLVQAGQQPRRFVFVSSSGVYAQAAGEWVDEQSPTEPSGYSGKIMLEAEALAHTGTAPATVVRLSGIYGPGRARLLNQVRQGFAVSEMPPVYANRIHADDAAGLIAFLLQADAQGKAVEDCYLGVDDAPVALAEVVAWLRQRMGVTHTSGEQSIRRTGSKRCSNARARALGWVPRYRSYQDGYAELLTLE